MLNVSLKAKKECRFACVCVVYKTKRYASHLNDIRNSTHKEKCYCYWSIKHKLFLNVSIIFISAFFSFYCSSFAQLSVYRLIHFLLLHSISAFFAIAAILLYVCTYIPTIHRYITLHGCWFCSKSENWKADRASCRRPSFLPTVLNNCLGICAIQYFSISIFANTILSFSSLYLYIIWMLRCNFPAYLGDV